MTDYRPIITDSDGVPVEKARLAERVFMSAPTGGEDPAELASLLRTDKEALEARYRDITSSNEWAVSWTDT